MIVLVVTYRQNEIMSCGQPLLVSVSQKLGEDATLTKFVCSGVIVSRDHMIALAECFSGRNENEVVESFWITSGSNFWYSSTKIHRIVNITKMNSVVCIEVSPSFPSCTYDGSAIFISDSKDDANVYMVRGWNGNLSPRIITRKVSSTQECIDLPGAVIIDQKNNLVGFQGVNCNETGTSRTTEVYYFSALIEKIDSCTNTLLNFYL